jgi:uncharacterized protein YdbL (DUF1318 family)
MRRWSRGPFWLLLALTCWGLLVMGALEVQAQSIGEIKKAGWVGERPDGYLGFVKPGAPGNVQSFVKNINSKRRAEYQKIAKKNKTSLKSVELIIGAKLIKRARPGDYVMNAAGKWTKK